MTDGVRQALVAEGIELFNHAEFFECHEALEDAWRLERGPDRFFLQSMIHVAVGLYHCRRGNRAGAEGQLRKGLKKLAGYLPEREGIDTGALYRESLAWLEWIGQAPDGWGGPPPPLPVIRRAGALSSPRRSGSRSTRMTAARRLP